MVGRLLTVPLVPLLALVVSAGPDASAEPVSIARCQSPAVTPLIIELTAASRAPGASGVAELVFAGSPFAAHVTPDGRYVYDVRLRVEGLRPAQGVYIAWIARTDLSEAVNLGPLGEDLTAAGTVDGNQFRVVVMFE